MLNQFSRTQLLLGPEAMGSLLQKRLQSSESAESEGMSVRRLFEAVSAHLTLLMMIWQSKGKNDDFTRGSICIAEKIQ